jgi:hypothetical protein
MTRASSAPFELMISRVSELILFPSTSPSRSSFRSQTLRWSRIQPEVIGEESSKFRFADHPDRTPIEDTTTFVVFLITSEWHKMTGPIPPYAVLESVLIPPDSGRNLGACWAFFSPLRHVGEAPRG